MIKAITLGLVSHDLSRNNHVDLISSKAQRMLNLLYRTSRDITDIGTKKLLYIAWIRSRLEYASVVWSPHTKRNINNLEQVQRRATRFLVGIIRSKSALVNQIYYLCSIVEKLMIQLTFLSVLRIYAR